MKIAKKIVSGLAIFGLLISSNIATIEAAEPVLYTGSSSYSIEAKKEMIIASYPKYEEDFINFHNVFGQALQKKMSGMTVSQKDYFLTNLDTKLQSKINLLESQEQLSGDMEFILQLLYYIQLVVEFSLEDVYDAQKALNLEKYKNPTLSQEEQKKVEDAMVDLQMNLFNWAKDYGNILVDNFEKYTNYVEKWNIDMSFNMDEETMWKVNAIMSFKNYVVKNSGFDSSIEWHLDIFFDSAMNGEEEINLDLSMLMNMISVNWSNYVKVDNLSIESTNIDEDFQAMLDMYKEMLDSSELAGKYLKLPEWYEIEVMMNMMNNLNPAKIMQEWEDRFSRPMFRAYDKQGDKYLLVPTKELCDASMYISHTLYPYWVKNNYCTEEDYNDFLEEFEDEFINSGNGKLYLTLGSNENTLWYEYNDKNIDVDTKIMYTDNYISSANLSVYPLEEKYEWEWFTIDYMRHTSLNMWFDVISEWFTMGMKSNLDNENRFTYIDFNYDYADTYDESEKINAKLRLENNKITWTLEATETGYDIDTWSRVPRYTYNATMNGNTDSLNKLSSLDFNMVADDLKNEDNYFEMNFNYSNSELSGSLQFEENWDLFKWDFSGRINWEGTLTEWTINMLAKEDEQTIFTMNYSLANELISGELKAYDFDWSEFFSLTTSGEYRKDYLKLDNNFSMKDIYSEQIKKARDSIRISDLHALSSSVEQYYQDYAWTYPTKENFEKEILDYLPNIPSDPLGAVEIDGCKFGYYYEVWDDSNGIARWSYRLSTCLEWDWTYYASPENDWWIYNNKYEKGIYGVWKDFAKEEFYINWYTSWQTKNSSEEKELGWSLNMIFDSENTSNELDIDLKINYGGKEIILWGVKADYTRDYMDVEIEEPTDYIELEDLIDDEVYY